jgi:hypothetical protein
MPKDHLRGDKVGVSFGSVETEGASEITRAMTAAGVRALRAAAGDDDDEIVAAVFTAMTAARDAG